MAQFQSTQMLAIILGASRYPRAPKLAAGLPFQGSATDMLLYLSDPNGLAVPGANILDLFDDSRSPSDQLNDIADFLETRRQTLKSEGLQVTDLLLYYVGHGLFTRAGQAYCLAVRSTDENNEGASSIRGADLAEIIKGNATFQRRFLIVDCCFSANLYQELQSGPLQVARRRLQEEFPSRGTTLLCSSNSRDASLAPQGLSHTMFSDALIKVLRQGHPNLGPRLSISELGLAVTERLRDEYPKGWVRPEVHSPDQREGDVADLPLFPNPAYKDEFDPQKAAELQQIEDERRRLADEARLAEERRREQARAEWLKQDAAKAGRLAKEKAEAERVAAQEASERAAKAQFEREQREKAEQQERAKKLAESELIAREKEEQLKESKRRAKPATPRRQKQKSEPERVHETNTPPGSPTQEEVSSSIDRREAPGQYKPDLGKRDFLDLREAGKVLRESEIADHRPVWTYVVAGAFVVLVLVVWMLWPSGSKPAEKTPIIEPTQSSAVAPPDFAKPVETTPRPDLTSSQPVQVKSEKQSSPGLVPRIGTPKRVRISSGVASGLLLRKVNPFYPPLARQARVQGTVVLAAEIAKDGAVKSLSLISGHPMLAPAAIEAVKQWQYKPYLLNGEAVEVETQIQVNFTLSGG